MEPELSASTRAEFAAALTKVRQDARLTVREVARTAGVPVGTTGGYFSGRHLPSLTYLDPFHAVLDAMGVTDHEPWVAALEGLRWTPTLRAAGESSPYKGLDCYEPEDAEWFFGRDAVVDDVLAALRARLAATGAGRIVAVVGPSGSGKSSVLRAGVVARVRAGSLDGEWRALVVTPGADPLGSLAVALGTEGTATAITAALGSGPSTVLVVDQLEELFTHVADPEVRAAFVDVLASAGERTLVVLGLRADFYGSAAGIPALVPVLQGAQVVVGPMSADDLRLAVTGPARRAGVELEADLVDRVLRDIAPSQRGDRAHDAGALPLLSHALRATWERSKSRTVTLEDYLATGGIDGAVAQTADQVFDGLSPEGQQVAHGVFLRLVRGEGEFTVRRRVTWDELVDPHREDDLTTDVLERFIAARLLTADADTVEVAHEALLTAWPRIEKWIDEDRDGHRLQLQVTDAARSWADAGRDPSMLWRGARLVAARSWAADPDRPGATNPVERAFLDESAGAAAAELDDARRRTNRLRALLGAVAVLAVIGLVLAGLAVTSQQRASDAADEAEAAAGEATTQRTEAESRQVAIQARSLAATDPALAQQIALAAYRISPTVEARSALVDVSSQPAVTRIAVPTGPASVAVSGDGSLIATGNVDGHLRLFSIDDDGSTPLLGDLEIDPENPMYGVAISPDNTLVAIGGPAEFARLVDISDPTAPVLLDQELSAPAVEGMRFSPDGTMLVASTALDAAFRWRLADDGTATEIGPIRGFGGYLHWSDYSPDGRLIATSSSDGTVRIWDADEKGDIDTPLDAVSVGATVSTPAGPTANAMPAVDFSSDGKRLAVAAKDGKIHLFRVVGDRLEEDGAPFGGFTNTINHVEFSPDGTEISGGSSDLTVRSYDVATRAETGIVRNTTPITSLFYVGDTGQVVFGSPDGFIRIWRRRGPSLPLAPNSISSVGFADDGALLATGDGSSLSAQVRLWDVSDRTAPVELGRVESAETDVLLSGESTLSRDGALLAAGTAIGQVQLFDVTDPSAPEHTASLTASDTLINQMAISPTSELLAVAADDTEVTLWDVSDPGAPEQTATIADAADRVLSVAISPDGSTLVAASADQSAYVYDVTDSTAPELVATLTDFENFVHAVAFAPDGATVAIGSDDAKVRLYDVGMPAEPELLGELTGPIGYVYGVAFSADGTSVVAVADGVGWRWDVSDPAHGELVETLRASTGGLYNLATSPVDPVVVAGGSDRKLFSWSTDAGADAERICALAGEPLREEEWARFFPGQEFVAPCP